MERIAHKSLPLILAREFASNLATPLAVHDADGTLIFFNEPAERIIGQSPAELGALPEREWRSLFTAEHLDGTPVGEEEIPTVRARRERHPAHETLRYKMWDGRQRILSVTAIPLLAHEEELVGIVAVFWEEPDE